MKRLLLSILALPLFLCLGSTAEACTTAVFAGKATSSGRPMLWKVRDSDFFHNYVYRHRSAEGWFVGISNVEDADGEQIWSGHNDRGFAIMNSASFNVNADDPATIADREGYLMRRALEECATLEDFEKLLDGLLRPMGLAAHFGVIDAEGGAALYEVNNYSWTKLDANATPEGYIIRSNYSETGTPDKGYGYVRARNAADLLSRFDTLVTVDFISDALSRSFYNAQLGIDFGEEYLRGGFPKGFINSDDLISRFDTASVTITEGINADDDPDQITTWVHIGLPYLCPLIPVWTWQEIPAELDHPSRSKEQTIAELTLRLKERLYPLRTVERSRYLYLPLLIDKSETGLLQRIRALEQEALPAIAGADSREVKQPHYQQYLERCRELLQETVTVEE